MILPIYAGLERIPESLLEASADLGGTVVHDVPACDPPARVPGGRRGLDLHVLAHARRLHRARADHERAVHRDGDLRRFVAQALPIAAAYSFVPIVVMIVYLLRRPQAEGVRVALMVESRVTRYPPARRRVADARVHLPPARRDRAVRVQRERHAGLADRELHDEVVLGRLPRRGRSRGAEDLGARRHSGRPRSRSFSGRSRRIAVVAVPVLRARGDHVRRDPPDRASRAS